MRVQSAVAKVRADYFNHIEFAEVNLIRTNKQNQPNPLNNLEPTPQQPRPKYSPFTCVFSHQV